jgi:hypothetical protein
VTDSLAVELRPGDGGHIRLVATSCPVKVALVDLGALTEALKGAVEAMAEAADLGLDHTGVVIGQDEGDAITDACSSGGGGFRWRYEQKGRL